MTSSVKFKLNVKTGEIEVEGSEAFVERQIQSLEALVQLMGLRTVMDRDEIESSTSSTPLEFVEVVESQQKANNPPESFGEWMHTFQTDLSDHDKALITASFVQMQSSTNDFKTSEVNSALKDHGIKLSNPSVSLKRLGDKKLMFQTRKVGKLKFMRVSQDGQTHLATLKR